MAKEAMSVDGEVKVYFLDKKSEKVELSVKTKDSVLDLKTLVAQKLSVGLPEVKIFINGYHHEDDVSLSAIRDLEGALVLVKSVTDESNMNVDEEDPGQDPLLRAAELRDQQLLKKSKDPPPELVELCKEHNMKHMYETAWAECGWKVDPAVVKAMDKFIADKAEEHKKAMENAEENAGDMEILRVKTQIAEVATKTSSPEDAVQKWDDIIKDPKKKTVSTNKKINVLFDILKIYLAYHKKQPFNERLVETKELVESGGDWTALNICSIFDAMSNMWARNFEKAAELLMKSIATYTATDIMTYDRYLQYTILCACLAVERKDLQKKIVESSDVKGAEVPLMLAFVKCLTECTYKNYFPLLLQVLDFMKRDRHLQDHVQIYFRAMRLKAYKQFFVAFKTVTLQQLADTFGVSQAFVDKDLADFICSGKLPCKIDKAEGVVESQQEDPVNQQYHKIIKLGDNLLNKISKLSHLINV